jgi:hypothetical protein
MELIQERLLSSNGHTQRDLGRLAVVDDQLFESGSLVTDNLRNRQVRLGTFHMEPIAGFAYLGMISIRRKPLAPQMPQYVSEVHVVLESEDAKPVPSASKYGGSKSMKVSGPSRFLRRLLNQT